MSKQKRKDQSYTSRGIFREETLYYDLGYRFSTLRGRKPVKAINIDLTSFLLMISLLLQFAANIQQFLTLIVLVVYYVYSSYFSGREEKSTGLGLLVLIMILFVFDHLLAGVSIPPGNLVSSTMSPLAWVLEVSWILVFSTQLLIILQPTTKVIDQNKSVIPETDLAKEEYRQLRARLKNTDYQIRPLKRIIDIDLLRTNFIDLLKIISIIVGSILVVDIFIWQIVGSFGGGNNVEENYFISGLVLVLLLFLFFANGLLYPSDAIGSNESNENEKKQTDNETKTNKDKVE